MVVKVRDQRERDDGPLASTDRPGQPLLVVVHGYQATAQRAAAPVTTPTTAAPFPMPTNVDPAAGPLQATGGGAGLALPPRPGALALATGRIVALRRGLRIG